MRATHLIKASDAHLQVEDFICRKCIVQATRNADHICGICRAIGKSVEPQPLMPDEKHHKFSERLAESVVLWLKSKYLLDDAQRKMT